MLWYKAWLETRWRFLIGLALLICSSAATVLVYPRVKELLPLVSPVGISSEIGRQIKHAGELALDFRGYMWSQWFGKSLIQIWTLFAALLGAGGVASQASAGGTLFTLSLPVSRNRLLAVRGGAGLAELLVLAVVPSLLVPSL